MAATLEAVRLMMGALLLIGTLLTAVFGPIPFVVYQWYEYQKSPSYLALLGFMIFVFLGLFSEVLGLFSLYSVGCMFEKEFGTKQQDTDVDSTVGTTVCASATAARGLPTHDDDETA